MRVFVTGATGFIGGAVVRDLMEAGHRVTGLARSEAAANALEAAGAGVHRASLEDLDGLRAGAEAAEGVIHTAFNHDFTTFRDNCEADRRVIAALGSGLAGSDRPLVVTSGIGILPQGRVSTEASDPATGAAAHPRAASEEAANALAAEGLPVSVVRLPPSVHGDGDRGFVPILIGIARRTGISAFIGDGANRWPAVHRDDAARLFRLALEHGSAGARHHGVAEEGILFRDIAGVIGRRLDLPVRSLTPDEAARHFGWFAHFAGLDCPTSSRLTQERLGWRPKGIGLLEDLDRPGYVQG
ncbi:SDR family oxidoreductase [Microvirga pudoricolor]|uniref:SDR family oxidoreductase n=1 Tax=Microvirga pudoricolor TaxID=2778729 RepID=UPI00194E3E5E|nr:SDR family oxidoreductase [Microvirga pudoricolor]MBM6593947.1 SDR family oxidoreductase [Microvirga pudoricolor]